MQRDIYRDISNQIFVINILKCHKMYLPFTLRVAVETASPFLLVALHMYTPESSALICDMFRAT